MSQPKITLKKQPPPKTTSKQVNQDQASMLPPQLPLAQSSNSHPTCHDSHQCDDHHHQQRDNSHHHKGEDRNSCQRDHKADTPHQGMQSKQMCHVYLTDFYTEHHQSAFDHLLPDLTQYISPLHGDPEVQRPLELLKNLPPKPILKAPPPPAAPMDIETELSSQSLSAPMTMT
uniref:Uncharacterized protein n=1 Tax=Romanomermis culicivorax TaxID=13658 RepID=A0A915HHU6_ROMCU